MVKKRDGEHISRNSHAIERGWPIITSGDWHTQEGSLYKLCPDGFWRQNVNYLAASPVQYGCTSYEEQFTRLIRKIEDGELRDCKSGGKPYHMGLDGYLTLVRSV